MRRARLLLCPLVFAVVFPGGAPRAEVTRETPLVEETGYTLRKGEWKIGILTSSYGITDRLQVDSALLLNLAILNAGLKYRLVDAPNLALSLNAFGGASAVSLALGTALFYGGARIDASMPLHEKVSLNVSGSWQYWNIRSTGDAAATLLSAGQVSWFHLKGGLQYVYRPRHIFFLTVASPTSWVASVGPGAHDFDALDFAQGMVGYQYSAGALNVRLDVGWGPSLFGRGPTLGLDLYFRFH